MIVDMGFENCPNLWENVTLVVSYKEKSLLFKFFFSFHKTVCENWLKKRVFCDDVEVEGVLRGIHDFFLHEIGAAILN